MADEDRSLKLGVDVDEASINRAKKRLQEIEKQQQEVHTGFLKGAKSADVYSKELAALDKEAAQLNKSLNALEDPRKIKIDAKQLNRDAQLDFADRSGDKASIAGLARGGLDAITGGNAGALGKFFEGAEGLFDLGEAAGKAGGPVGDLVKKIGPGGLLGAAAGAGIALVVLSKVLEDIQKQTQREVGAVQASANTLLEVNTAIEKGISSDEVTNRLQEINHEMNATVQTIEGVKAAQQRLVDEVFGGNRARASQSEAFKEFDTQIGVLEDSLGNLGLEQRKYTEATEDGRIAANDAAAAEKSLAEARAASVLNEAAQAGELASLKARVSDLTQEQIDSELEGLAIRKAALEAEIASLESSGDKSKEVSQKIDQLRESLSFLGEQSDVLKTARPKARSEAADKRAEEAERDREKAAQDAQRKVDEARRAQEQYTDAVKNAKQGYKDAVADIKQGLIDNLTDINQDLEDSLNEQAIEFQQNELAEETQFRRDLAQIRRDAERTEKDAVRQRDFAAVRDAREGAAEALSDRREDEAAANAQQLTEFRQQQDALGRERDLAARDANLDAQRARRDAAIARDRSIRDAQASYKDTLHMQNNFSQQFVGNFKTMFDSILAMQQQMSGTGSRTTSTRSTSRSSTGVSVDEMQYMVNGGR